MKEVRDREVKGEEKEEGKREKERMGEEKEGVLWNRSGISLI